MYTAFGYYRVGGGEAACSGWRCIPWTGEEGQNRTGFCRRLWNRWVLGYNGTSADGGNGTEFDGSCHQHGADRYADSWREVLRHDGLSCVLGVRRWECGEGIFRHGIEDNSHRHQSGLGRYHCHYSKRWCDCRMQSDCKENGCTGQFQGCVSCVQSGEGVMERRFRSCRLRSVLQHIEERFLYKESDTEIIGTQLHLHRSDDRKDVLFQSKRL